jgi:hypothetical protein
LEVDADAPIFREAEGGEFCESPRTFHRTKTRVRQVFRSLRDSLFGSVICAPAKFCEPAWYNSHRE